MNLKQNINKYFNFIIFSSLKFSTQILSLIINVIVVRQMTVENYGIYSVALVVFNFIVNFGYSWNSSSFIYIASKERAELGSIRNSFEIRNKIVIITYSIIILLSFVFRKEINNYIGLNLILLIIVWSYSIFVEDYIVKYLLVIKSKKYLR